MKTESIFASTLSLPEAAVSFSEIAAGGGDDGAVVDGDAAAVLDGPWRTSLSQTKSTWRSVSATLIPPWGTVAAGGGGDSYRGCASAVADHVR